jgi:LysM repeat protein
MTGNEYTIRVGDTLSSIASTYMTDVPALLRANPSIKDPNNINAGEVITIPQASGDSTDHYGCGPRFKKSIKSACIQLLQHLIGVLTAPQPRRAESSVPMLYCHIVTFNLLGFTKPPPVARLGFGIHGGFVSGFSSVNDGRGGMQALFRETSRSSKLTTHCYSSFSGHSPYSVSWQEVLYRMIVSSFRQRYSR